MRAKLAQPYTGDVAEIVWKPSPDVFARANVVRLMRAHGIDDYWELQRRSQEDPEWFWPAAIEDMGLEFSQPWASVLDLSRGPEWATWFVGGKLNVAWNCVHRWAERRADDVAAAFAGEEGSRRELTFGELSHEVTRLAEGLVSLGVEPGDRVAIYLPMCPEVAIASHACAHIGAVQVPIFSGFAAPAVAQRLQDSEAKVVITADRSLRKGRWLEMRAVVEEAAREAPSLEHVITWSRGDGSWDQVRLGHGELAPLEVDSEHPYLLTYTSGTTGRPKGVVHVQGGFLVSIAREVAYQADAGPADTILFATDMGWIMGPWTVVGGGATGSRLVFMEGAPDRPADRLWRLTEEERVTVLGCSPTLVRALMQHGTPDADLTAGTWSPARLTVAHYANVLGESLLPPSVGDPLQHRHERQVGQGGGCHGEETTRGKQPSELLKRYCAICGRDADQTIRQDSLLFCSEAHAKAYEEEMGIRQE